MSKLIIVIVLCMINFKNSAQNTASINGVPYNVKTDHILLTDTGVMTSSMSFSLPKSGFQFGYLVKGTRNDSTLIKGYMHVRERKIYVKEYCLYNHDVEKDSILKVFHQGKKGRIYLKEVVAYKNGVTKRKTSY